MEPVENSTGFFVGDIKAEINWLQGGAGQMLIPENVLPERCFSHP
jgi:hypothetical protein